MKNNKEIINDVFVLQKEALSMKNNHSPQSVRAVGLGTNTEKVTTSADTLNLNEQIELARQSGYNEACFVKDKELKEIEEELRKEFFGDAKIYSGEVVLLKIQDIFAKHKEVSK